MFRHSEHRVGMSSTRELFPGARLLMGGDLVTQSAVSISIFMHPLNVDWFRLLISSRSMIRYLQRGVSWWLAIVDGWRSGHSICCLDLNVHAPPQRWFLQIINLIKVYDSISSTQSELVAGDLVTQSVVSISIFMRPQRWLLQNINLIKVYDSMSSTQSEYQQQSRMQGCSWLAIWSLTLLFRSQLSCTLNVDCFRTLISSRSMIRYILRYLQRRVSMRNSRESGRRCCLKFTQC